jgi:hypothetical protein
LRNTHDVSPNGLDGRFETQLRSVMTVTAHEYERYTPLEKAVMKSPDPPEYFHELLEFRR